MLMGLTFVARNINGLNCDAIIGYPSPLTFWLFGRAMMRHLSAAVGPVELKSMLVLHHEYDLVGQYKSPFEFYPSKLMSGERTHGGAAAPISEDVLAHIKATVVFEIAGVDDNTALRTAACEWFTLDPAMKYGMQPAYGQRFAGGPIESARVFAADSIEAVKKNIPASRVYSSDNRNPTDGPFDAVSNYIHNVSPEKGCGFRIPSMMGYAMLETPVFRAGARDPKCKHVFAEPIMGRAVFLTPTLEHLNKSFWRLEQQGNTFVCIAGTPDFTANAI